MRRVQTGWLLLRGCLSVVRAVPVLLIPGAVQALATFALGALLFTRWGQDDAASLRWLLLAGVFLALSIVGTVTAAVVVVVTSRHMDGRPIGLRDGVRLVVPHLPGLLVWSVLNATVGAALRALEERLGPVGRVLSWGAGAVFAMATLLVVPIVLFEGGSTRAAVRRSSALFRQRWGEVAVSRGGLDVVLGLGWFAALVLVVGLLSPAGTVPVVVGAVVVTAAYLAVSATTIAVLSAALYRYALEGDGGPFGDLSRLFVPRGRQDQPIYAGPHGQWDAS